MKILFIPVSGKEGIGEYMRSIILAQSIEANFPDAQIHFAISAEAPYALSCPYPALITKRSPTYHVKEVNNYIDSFKPDVVVFDASGRAKQIKHAKQSGAYTIFIAQHDKKVRKGLKLTRLLHTDLILIAQPSFTMSKLGWWSKLKLNYLKKPNPEFLGCVFVPPTLEQEQEILHKYRLEAGTYVFASAGSGGHYFPDGSLAADGFNQALKDAELNVKYVQVWGANYVGNNFPADDKNNLNLTSVSNLEFITLLKNSKFSLINGGDTLLQALSLKIPFVAAPVSSDQPQRIEKALNHSECFLAAKAEVKDIAEKLKTLKIEINKELINNLNNTDVANGYDVFSNKVIASINLGVKPDTGNLENIKILFSPVSGKGGSGEYFSSMILADYFKEKLGSNIEIKFILSKEADYAKGCKYPVYFTQKSPTYHTKEVIDAIDGFQPDIVVFDASGRAAQLRHAKKIGAKTIFIAHYHKKINKGMKWNRIKNTDEIWVAQPEIAVDWKPSFWQRFKLKIFNKSAPVFLGSLYTNTTQDEEYNILSELELTKGEYLLVSTGSGSHKTRKGDWAANLFNNAVKELENIKVVHVWGGGYPLPIPDTTKNQLNIRSLENKKFITLLKNCKAALIGAGGGTLMQAIEFGIPYLAVPMRNDQLYRVKTLSKNSKCNYILQDNEDNLKQELKRLLENPKKELVSLSKSGCEEAAERLGYLLSAKR